MAEVTPDPTNPRAKFLINSLGFPEAEFY